MLQRKKRLLIILFALSLIILVAIGGVIIYELNTDPIWPTVAANPNVNPQDIAAIKAVIVKAANVETDGLVRGNLQNYPDVFIDDPAIPLDRQYDNIANDAQNRLKNFVNHHGWLSYKLAVALNYRASFNAYLNVVTARANGHTADPNQLGTFGVKPSETPTPPGLYSDAPTSDSNFWWEGFAVDNNQAIATYNSCTHFKTFLAKTISGWRIAGSRITQMCRG